MVASRVSLHIFPWAKFIWFSVVGPFILCGGLLDLQWVLGLVALVFLDTEPLPCSHSLLNPSCLTKNLPLNVKSFQFSWGALGKFRLFGPISELLIENPQRSSLLCAWVPYSLKLCILLLLEPFLRAVSVILLSLETRSILLSPVSGRPQKFFQVYYQQVQHSWNLIKVRPAQNFDFGQNCILCSTGLGHPDSTSRLPAMWFLASHFWKMSLSFRLRKSMPVGVNNCTYFLCLITSGSESELFCAAPKKGLWRSVS